MPPSRRRPVPTPPAGGRPKVAGLNRPTTDANVSVTREPRDATDASQDTRVTDEQPAGVETATELEADVSVTREPRDARDASWGSRVTVPGGWGLAAALVVVALLLGGLGFWFQQQAGKSKFDAALVDSAATAEVNGQVREGVEKAFSYNFADVAATEKAANELLTGKAKCQYNAVFGPVKTLAPQQKLVVTVKVVASAVSSLSDDHATVLVFVDQVTTRTTDNQTGGGTAMLRAGAQRADGRWKIDNMEMFGQTPEQAQQMAQCQG